MNIYVHSRGSMLRMYPHQLVGLLTLLAIVVLEPCAHTKLDFCGMIRFLWLALLW